MTLQSKAQILWNGTDLLNKEVCYPQTLIDYLQTYLSSLEESYHIEKKTDFDGNEVSVTKAEFWGEFLDFHQTPCVEDWKLYLSNNSKIKSYNEGDYYGCSSCGDGGCPSCDPQSF